MPSFSSSPIRFQVSFSDISDMANNVSSISDDGLIQTFVPSKIVCVGRNYAAHAAELNNPVPDSPILFIKPNTALCPLASELSIPKDMGEVHHEAEIALLIGTELKSATVDQARDSIIGVGAALDLTLRTLQSDLKAKGLPWERAKAFDGACPISDFVSVDDAFWQNGETIKLIRNGHVQQNGHSREMLFPMAELVAYMSTQFTLKPGDIVLTGTPAGVGPLNVGDRLEVSLGERFTIRTEVGGA